MSSVLKAPSKLRCFSAASIPAVWGAVSPHIQRALDRGSRYTLDEIRAGLVASQMQLWAWVDGGIEACLVTTIQTDDESTFCLLLALGGSKMEAWIEFLPLVEEWARDNGATEMRIYGRIGWAKVTGYGVDYTKMSKRL